MKTDLETFVIQMDNFFLVLNNEQERVKRSALANLRLFKENPEILRSGSYTVKSDVNERKTSTKQSFTCSLMRFVANPSR